MTFMLGSAALTPLTQPRRACGGKREEGRPGSQGGCVEGGCAAYGRPQCEARTSMYQAGP